MSEFFKNDSDLNEAYAAEVNRLNLISEEFDAFLKETVRNYPSDKTQQAVASRRYADGNFKKAVNRVFGQAKNRRNLQTRFRL